MVVKMYSIKTNEVVTLDMHMYFECFPMARLLVFVADPYYKPYYLQVNSNSHRSSPDCYWNPGFCLPFYCRLLSNRAPIPIGLLAMPTLKRTSVAALSPMYLFVIRSPRRHREGEGTKKVMREIKEKAHNKATSLSLPRPDGKKRYHSVPPSQFSVLFWLRLLLPRPPPTRSRLNKPNIAVLVCMCLQRNNIP